MDKSAVWNVLKCVPAGLAAGFIRQFGRSLPRVASSATGDAGFIGRFVLLLVSQSRRNKTRRLEIEEQIEKKRARRKLKRKKKRSG